MKPPKEIPVELRPAYTMGGKIPVSYRYFDGVAEGSLIYTMEQINALIAKATRLETNYYGETDLWLYQSFNEFPIKDKRILIIGSTVPWYEAICIAFGARDLTVFEYNIPQCGKEIERWLKIKYETPCYSQNIGEHFDAVIAISSVEHSGLGRYGDPLDPVGDLVAMTNLRFCLKENGLLYLVVPEGLDNLVWNAHRVYGKLRMPLLLDGYEQLGYCGRDNGRHANGGFQPIRVLRKKW